MPYDPELAQRMREVLQSRDGIKEIKMFGGYCWTLNGNMLCGVEVGRYMFRVGRDLECDALARPGVRPMDITGKPMRGFVWVSAEATLGDGLQQWVAFAQRYVDSLPPKRRPK